MRTPFAIGACLLLSPVLLPAGEGNVITHIPSYVRLFKDSPLRAKPAAQKPASTMFPREQKLVPDSPPAPRCAHMIIKKVDPEIDPGLAVKTPPPGRMPTFRGLPGCPEDIRR